MGIPSFYRHLLRSYPALVAKGAGPRPEWLCLDFNCAMYTVLRMMPPLPSQSAASQDAWEERLCRDIAAYMKEIVQLVNPTKGAYVSCDGVVCAAKRRQQRLRRFKGPWMAAAEAAVKAAAGSADVRASATATAPTHSWDQNALTPGTAFMSRLGGVLVAAGRTMEAERGIEVRVSTTGEPGEGEHKILCEMRKIRPATCTIYGLDADLILLSMLLEADTGADVRLLREAQEFEARRVDHGAPVEWRNLTVSGLTRVLLPATDAHRVRDYVAGMSLLGNDFLPRSLTHTVRENGIPTLIRSLQSVWSSGRHLVDPVTWEISREGLLDILEQWSETEAADMQATAAEAVRTSTRRPYGSSPAERELRAWQAQPARWCSISHLLKEKTAASPLAPNWRDTYNKEWHAGDAESYLGGLAWVWDYYSGKAVDQGWFFEEHLPPLWSDLVSALRASTDAAVRAPPITWADPLPAWTHLLSVLPMASVQRLSSAQAQALMTESSWWWPSEWSLFDIGRGQMWECEPVIPVIPESVLRIWAASSA